MDQLLALSADTIDRKCSVGNYPAQEMTELLKSKCRSATELFLVQPQFLLVSGIPLVGTGNHLAGDLFRYFPADQSFGSVQSILTSFTWEVVNGVAVLRVYWDRARSEGPIRVQFVLLFYDVTWYQDITSNDNPVVLDQISQLGTGAPFPPPPPLLGAQGVARSHLAIDYNFSKCITSASCSSNSLSTGVYPFPALSGNTQLFVIPVDYLVFIDEMGNQIGQGQFPPIQLLGCPFTGTMSWTVVDGLTTLTVNLPASCRVAVQFDLYDVSQGSFNQYLETEGTSIVLNDIRNVVTGVLYSPAMTQALRVANLSFRCMECCPADSELWEIAPDTLETIPPPNGGVLTADIPQMTKLIPTGRTGLLSSLRPVGTPIITANGGVLYSFSFVLTWPSSALECLRPVSISIALALGDEAPPSNWQELAFHTTGFPVSGGDFVTATTEIIPGFYDPVGQAINFIDYTRVAIRYSCCFDPDNCKHGKAKVY